MESAGPERRLRVDADLSKPGSVPDPNEVRHERDLSKPRAPRDVFVWPDNPWPYMVDTRCGIEWLGKMNGVAWRADDPIPKEWEEMAETYDSVEVTITLRAKPEPLIEAAHGMSVVYKPADEEMPKCDQP